MRPALLVSLVLASLLALGLSGCASRDSGARRAVSPADFAATRPAGDPATVPGPAAPLAAGNGGAADPAVRPPTAPSALAGNGAATQPATNPADDAEAARLLGGLPKPSIIAGPATTQPATAFAVDGMVGQVNGQPIYATKVFEPLSEQLDRLGQTLSAPVFRREAASLIARRLNELVMNALILGEAERDLSAQEQQGVNGYMKEKREEFVRRWGTGAPTVADMNLRDKTGKGLEEMLTEYRQAALVQRYKQQKFWPKINVARKDIERYYRDHPDEFQAKSGRTLRLIRTTDTGAAEQIDQMLAAGQPFATVAASAQNQYKRNEDGLFGRNITDVRLFGDPLDQAMLALKAGQHSPRIKVGETFWWIFVAKIEGGQARTLRDAQHDIEELLRQQRYQYLFDRYLQKLRTTGTFHPLDQMLETLMQVAMTKYAR